MECFKVFVFLGACSIAVGYENKLTKLWSSVTPQRTVVNVESDTYIVPEGYSGSDVYFKPRKQEDQVERTARYSDIQTPGQFKSEILFPGSYFPIAEAKKNESGFDPLERTPFKPKIIPLMRNNYEGRSLGADYDTELQDGQPSAMRRSYVYFDEDEEDEDEEGKDEEGEEKGKRKRPKIKKKYMKYMLPLLLAYKLKFFTLIPLLMGGMVLLTGATGLAGFFFALFAAVMGLSKSTSQ